MKEYILELLEKGKRMDGRNLDEYRNIKVERGVVEKAEGSAWVQLGETKVLAGVKMEIGTPFPDSPNDGILIVNAEFTPLASPAFEPGPPGEDAIELARMIDRVLREGKAIDLSKLVITPGEKVWCVFIDIDILNHKGNLIDASCLASVAALLDAKIPKVEDDKIIRGEYERKLEVNFKPVIVSVCKVGEKYLVDPLEEEEEVIDCKLCIGVRDDDLICAIQKQGKKSLRFEDIEKMVDIAISKSKVLRRFLDGNQAYH